MSRSTSVAKEELLHAAGVDVFRVTDRLSDSESATLLGGTLQKVCGWALSKD